jgi:CHAD domain-containing protein
MAAHVRFELGTSVDLDAIQAALGAGLHLEPAAERTEARLHLDTWEGRLFRAGWSLHAEAADAGRTRLVLGRLDQTPLASEEQERIPAFAWEFPEGALRNLLAPLTKVRRLSPLAELGRAVRPYRVVGTDGRAVASLEVDRISAGRTDGTGPAVELTATLEVVSLGDPAVFEHIATRLAACPGLGPVQAGALGRALLALDRLPGDNPCKLKLQLDVDARADATLRRICGRLLSGVEATVQGTRLQTDTEFLHDLRVSARRSRAALSQLKKVFAAEAVAGFRADLKWLGDVTGAARDLDVFLLRWVELTAPLGSADQAALAPVHQRLDERRQEVQVEVISALDAPRFAAFVTDWRRFLEGDGGEGPHASRTAPRVASGRIRKQHCKVLARGAALDASSPADDLHAMRLECKKLRYLLEMFGSLYPADEVRGLIRSLKQFQDTLGDFNDLAIQRQILQDAGDALTDLDPTNRRALDRLIESLDARQDELRQRFADRFARFAGEEIQAVFERLFR